MSAKNQTLVAQASNLSGLIGYQEGSVVSRTGTVTLFAFDESQGLSEHVAPFDALLYVLDGEAQVTVSCKSITVKEGEITVLPANEPHALAAKTKFKMLLVMIKA